MKLQIEISEDNFSFINERCNGDNSPEKYVQKLIQYNIDVLKNLKSDLHTMGLIFND